MNDSDYQRSLFVTYYCKMCKNQISKYRKTHHDSVCAACAEYLDDDSVCRIREYFDGLNRVNEYLKD